MITSIILAAGRGKRMNKQENKAFLSLAGKPILVWALQAFEDSKVDNIIIVSHPIEIERVKELVNEYSIKKVMAIFPGGDQRQDSVANALAFLPAESKIVAIHDSARPLVGAAFINETIDSLNNADGIVPAIMPTDTIKEESDNFVVKTLERKHLRAVQTPQVFTKEPLLNSYEKAKGDGYYGTDDASLLEKYGYKVKLSEGSYGNIKITTPIDLKIAELLLSV